MRVSVQTRPVFRAGQPSLLFQGNYTYGYLDWSFNYDVTPDASRFAMVEEGPATRATLREAGSIGGRSCPIVFWFSFKKRIHNQRDVEL